jgi:ABC-type multidrug transport system permease subunit
MCIITLIHGHFKVFKTILTDFNNATLNVFFIYFLCQYKPNVFGWLLFITTHLFFILISFAIEQLQIPEMSQRETKEFGEAKCTRLLH